MATECLTRLSRFLRVFSRSFGASDQPLDRKKRDDEPWDPVDPELEAAFNEAAQQASGLSGLSVGERLSLYALYKQATTGDAPATEPASLLDPAARHKWKAWSKVVGMSRADAMRQYVEAVAGGGGDEPDDDTVDDAELDAIDSMMGGMAGAVQSSLAGSMPEEDDSETIPLHAAAKRGDAAQCEALVDGGADVDELDEDRHTALHWACDAGSLEAARCLLEHGATPSVQNIDGSTPLHMACTCEHADVVRLLLACGADATLRDDDGCTAADHAPDSIKAVLGQ